MLAAGLQPIPGYRTTRLLGTGAFGEVWEARAPEGPPVALKFLDCRSKPTSLIRSEIRVLQGLRELRHPNIIEFHGVHAHTHYIVLCMERADGNLADLHRTYRAEFGMHVPGDHALELLWQAAEALDFLAGVTLPGFNTLARGLQHCDVKPTNLLLVGEQLKVADFGLCAATAWRTHRNGGWRGTLPYAAPELYSGQASQRTDQYALAVTYCELCYGDRLFIPPRPMPPGTACPDPPVDLMKVPEQEARVLARALSPYPTARWPSCQEFLAALVEARRKRRSGIRRVVSVPS
jgi:serine/threonine protein kinase